MSLLAVQRLYNQGLEQSRMQTPGEVVGWLGAVQAQEYALAKWALGLRMDMATDAQVEQAFNQGLILRTHVMRPTWHFVTPADIRWLLELTAPRVNAVNAYMYRKLELDDALLVRSNAAIAQALTGGKHLTRLELATVLARAGIQADGMRLGYIVHRAELDAVVCSGPRRGKQFTYALLDERAPHARTLSHEEALAELVRRYFTGHGPAMVQDFVWWSGLTVADAKAGLDLAQSDLIETVIDRQTYWAAASASIPPAPEKGSPTALLLPPYDEYTNYRQNGTLLDPAYLEQAKTAAFPGVTVIDGQMVGNWRRTLQAGAVVVESAPFRLFTAAEQDAFAAAAARFAAFLGLPVVLM